MGSQHSCVEAYVIEASGDKIRVKVLDKSIEQSLSAYGFEYHNEWNEWQIQGDESAKCEIFHWLRDMGGCFANGPAGWPPGAIFELLREQNKLSGDFRSISWRGPNDYYVEIK
ncbi:hypothetical protein [Grimontia marina]|uniref:Uncharacterized protein n=1 Tax=Grimontia marina TaxID=646534 RepID=A0A128FJH4_9GAMM|nr:hypothetical protein [Grimontia marina]CZF86959.1 hypothetical protein GMA8713_05000 [Grimontia marina]